MNNISTISELALHGLEMKVDHLIRKACSNSKKYPNYRGLRCSYIAFSFKKEDDNLWLERSVDINYSHSVMDDGYLMIFKIYFPVDQNKELIYYYNRPTGLRGNIQRLIGIVFDDYMQEFALSQGWIAKKVDSTQEVRLNNFSTVFDTEEYDKTLNLH